MKMTIDIQPTVNKKGETVGYVFTPHNKPGIVLSHHQILSILMYAEEYIRLVGRFGYTGLYKIDHAYAEGNFDKRRLTDTLERVWNKLRRNKKA
jgi:hypothetical protein